MKESFSKESKRIPCITDTSVIVGLYKGGVLELASYSFLLRVPDLIIAEELACRNKNYKMCHINGNKLIREGIIQKIEFSGFDMEKLYGWRQNDKQLSLYDYAAMYAAQRDGLILLADDKKLRQKAKREGIEVHGSLWIVDFLVINKMLSPRDGILVIQNMQNNGHYLPSRQYIRSVFRWTA